jgi:crotonobetainyl-CoA:carnitine CoA-transferase CaiB-like acyl-CoA transferase
MIPGIYGVFPTADGWIAIVGTAGPARDLFYRTIGRPDLIDRFHHLLYYEEDKAELWPILDGVFASKSTAAWCQLLGAAGLRFAPVRNHAEVVDDPGVQANGYIASARNSGSGDTEVRVVRPPVRFSDPSPTAQAHVPELGQHTEEVLLEAGYSWDEINALASEGAI